MSDVPPETAFPQHNREDDHLVRGPYNSPTKTLVQKLDKDFESDQDHSQLDSPRARSTAEAGDSFRMDKPQRNTVVTQHSVGLPGVTALTKSPVTENQATRPTIVSSKARSKGTRVSKPLRMPDLTRLNIVPGTKLLLAPVEIDGVTYPPKLPEGHPQNLSITTSYNPFVIYPDDELPRRRHKRPEYVFLDGPRQCDSCRDLARANWPGREPKGSLTLTPHVGCVIDISKNRIGGCGECRLHGIAGRCTIKENPHMALAEVPPPIPVEQMMGGLAVAPASANALTEIFLTTEAVQVTHWYFNRQQNARGEIVIDRDIARVLKRWFRLAQHKDYGGPAESEFTQSMAFLDEFFSDDNSDEEGMNDTEANDAADGEDHAAEPNEVEGHSV